MTERLHTVDPVLRISAPDPTSLIDAVDDPSFPLVAVGATGHDQLEPLAIATAGDTTAFNPQCTPAQVRPLVQQLESNELDTTSARWVVQHQPHPQSLPIPTESPLAVGTRDILDLCGWIRPTRIDDYQELVGFSDAKQTRIPDQLEGLQGRGWGDIATDIPVLDVWDQIQAQSEPPVVVVNAHDSPLDRLLLESTPLAVLDAARLTAGVIQATEILVYTSEEADLALHHTNQAIDNLPEGIPVQTTTGPPEYRAGEPTMALEAIEGASRIEARRRPPTPVTHGLNHRPTAIHTPRTLVQILATIQQPDRDPTRLFTYTGDVEAPTTVELPHMATLKDGVGAVETTGAFKAAAVGGQFGGFTQDLEIPATAGGLGDADLGTDGRIEILTTDRCVVAEAGQQVRTASETNCGRCVPCREGTTQLVALLRDVYDGQYHPDKIQELCRVMDTTSLCAFGIHAARPARTALARFESEVTAHAAGDCPAGVCNQATLPDKTGIPS